MVAVSVVVVFADGHGGLGQSGNLDTILYRHKIGGGGVAPRGAVVGVQACFAQVIPTAPSFQTLNRR